MNNNNPITKELKTQKAQYIANKAISLIKRDINTIIKELNSHLANIIINNIKYNINIIDLGYDVSDEVCSTGKHFDIHKYNTVEDFLIEEATGYLIPTFMSGSGFMAETYEMNFRDLLREKTYKIARRIFEEETNNTDDAENDLIDYFDECFWGDSMEIENEISEIFYKQKICSIFIKN